MHGKYFAKFTTFTILPRFCSVIIKIKINMEIIKQLIYSYNYRLSFGKITISLSIINGHIFEEL